MTKDEVVKAEENTEVSPLDVENQSNEGAETQVATEQEGQKSESVQERNWKAANESMRSMGGEIRALKAELAKSKEPPKPARDRDDIPTVGDVDDLMAKKEAELNQKLAILEARAQYPEMDKTIEKYGKLLPESVKMAVLRADNPHIAAYEACMLLAEKDNLANTVHAGAKRVKENLNKVGSASSVGGTGTLSDAKRFENMSEEEVLEHSQKILNG
jgi:hypothetical protein